MRYLIFLALFVSCASKRSGQDHLTMATLWMQHSGEYRALSLQAFSAAKAAVDEELKKSSAKKRAIILDVDETVLDNSPYQGRMIIHDQPYTPNSWNAWVDERNAEALPGAVEFLNYAAKKGIAIFYVTNRPDSNRIATIDNLKRRGFPVNPEHVQTKGDDSSKQKRRDVIFKNHNVIMLVGDNLGDFDKAFYEQDNAKRRMLVDERQALWGKRFIVLPNPMYGDWESPMYEGFEKSQRHEARMKALRVQPVNQLFDKR